MLFTTSQDSIKRAFEYLAKLPFTKNILHKLSEKARGHYIAYFSLHRVLEESPQNIHHPHLLNRSAISPKKAHRLLTYINQRLPFVALADSIELLKGNQRMNRSFAVLLIEVPYLQTIRQLIPMLEEMRIPATIIINTDSLLDGQMPWMDEIVFRIGNTSQKEISVNFIDRAFSLATMQDRMRAAQHFIDHLSNISPSSLRIKLDQLRHALSEVAIYPVSERICTAQQLEKVALNPLFSFACAGRFRLPFFDISQEEAEKEIVSAQQILFSMFSRSVNPVFFYPLGADRKHQAMIQRIFLDNGLEAAIGSGFGVCRPGDNMFRLLRLPLTNSVRGFEQFELQGLSDAIDELLLVTFAKDREL
jgi:hypothetical protein